MAEHIKLNCLLILPVIQKVISDTMLLGNLIQEFSLAQQKHNI